MFNSDTDLLFPPRLIHLLRNLRGRPWQNLVDRIQNLEPENEERLAFVLLMCKLGSCTSCQADSFRALRGCSQCANQMVRRFRGTDQDLLDLFDQSLKEVNKYLGK
jgi:hypothetical protein